MSEPYWEPLAAAPAAPFTLPPRLNATTITVATTGDLNAVESSGWYVVPSSAPNSPDGSKILHLEVIAYDADHVIQTAYDFFSDAVYRRRQAGGVWAAWRKISAPEIQTGLATFSGMANGTPYSSLITFPVAFSVAPAVLLTVASYSTANGGGINLVALTPTTTNFTLWVFNENNGQTANIRWLAVVP